ncbi:MAG: fibronectin type III domain-containing protein [Burkholderiales bacterium]
MVIESRLNGCRFKNIALAMAICLSSNPAFADDSDDDLPRLAKGQRCLEFSELSMTLEQNATDGDTEVVLFAKGQDEGLKRLVIKAPDGRRVANVKGDPHGIGIREFNLESAEPEDLDLVLGSFPEGTYHFFGRTVTGECLKGDAPLSHAIAPATTLLTPSEGEVVPVNQVVLSWMPIADAERYVVELNNETTGGEATFEVFPPTTSVAISVHFLKPGSEYQFVVGVKTESGNVAFVELTFSTAP